MSVFLPFNGLLPKPEMAAKVAAVPYDVVNTQEATAIADGNPYSFLRISRPEIELEAGIDLYSDEVYDKAAQNFERLCKSAPLEMDSEPHLYVYKLKMGSHVQTGLVGAASTEDYKNEIIKKHEKTRQDKEDDRAKHVMTLRSQTGPVFLTYKDSPEINSLVEQVTINAKPDFDFTAEDGIQHSLWRIPKELSFKISSLFEKIPYLYIADGHHRAASAARAAQTCKLQNPSHTGEEDYNFFLTVTFPASQLKILPYNRVVHSLNKLSISEFLGKISENFDIKTNTSPNPEKSGDIRMFIDGKWYRLIPKMDINSLGVIGSLDVSVLQDYILNPILGIEDPRTSKKIDFVGGIRGTQELEKLVNSGKGAVAFSMYPTTLDQLMAIADANEIMPPKSTWFEPKLRDGLVCHNF